MPDAADLSHAPRRAVPDDAGELVRLRAVMFEAMGVDVQATAWRDACERDLGTRLAAGGDVAGFVVEKPTGGLASCALGIIRMSLPGPSWPDGRVGYLLNVATDPANRRRGHARAVVEALVQWFDEEGISRVDLFATPEGDGLYRELGFRDSNGVSLTRTLSRGRARG
jgi:ribosomal protein S18 acetylase RimI-like enzyme